MESMESQSILSNCGSVSDEINFYKYSTAFDMNNPPVIFLKTEKEDIPDDIMLDNSFIKQEIPDVHNIQIKTECEMDPFEEVPPPVDNPYFIQETKVPGLIEEFKQFDEQRQAAAMKTALARKNETPDQRAARLERNRIRNREKRLKEAEDETKMRRYKNSITAAFRRANETEEERKQRLERNRLRVAEKRKNMTPEEREQWKLKCRIQTQKRREKEPEYKKIIRKYNEAIRQAQKRVQETPEQRMERKRKDAERRRERRKNETEEQRQERLKKDRERIALKRLDIELSETPEQREARLKKERERKRKPGSIGRDRRTSQKGDIDSQYGSEDSFQSSISSIFYGDQSNCFIGDQEHDSLSANIVNFNEFYAASNISNVQISEQIQEIVPIKKENEIESEVRDDCLEP